MASKEPVNTVSDLELLPVWVNPEHRISSARILLQGHRLRSLAVVDEDQLVGLLSPERLAEAPEDGRVRDFMLPVGALADIKDPLREIADKMVKNEVDSLPVLGKGKFLGIVTARMLLPLLGRTWDPLTGLGWSDRLREWGVDKLQEGHEVTILFLDLDDFGKYNKQYGHVVGDRVLQRIAGMLKSVVTEPEDLLVRYAGDEFAIGTIRTREQAEGLAESILRRGTGLFVSGSDEPVTYSVGLFGGRRTKEREQTHFMATLDNLINLASKDALAKKAKAKKSRAAMDDVPASVGQPEVAAGPTASVAKPSAEQAAAIIDLSADDASENAPATVMLQRDGKIATGVHSRQGIPLVEAVVLAAAKAMERLYPGRTFALDEVRLKDDGGVKSVAVRGTLTFEGREHRAGAVKTLVSDPYRAAAEAMIDAFLGPEA